MRLKRISFCTSKIVIIALGTVQHAALLDQILSLIIVGILATVGVYGVVALIVRTDDVGFSIIKKSHNKGFFKYIKYTGETLVRTLPVIIKLLGVVGIIALLFVGGGICLEKYEFLKDCLPSFPEILIKFIIGFIVGLIVFIIVFLVKKINRLVRN